MMLCWTPNLVPLISEYTWLASVMISIGAQYIARFLLVILHEQLLQCDVGSPDNAQIGQSQPSSDLSMDTTPSIQDVTLRDSSPNPGIAASYLVMLTAYV